ncbi:abortive infection system antitoxin AbiGi family protein [Sphingobacterium sp.]|uniref:abortive infection system antitoxin AbiGi family protein n=1 Tax=Sphingobacterium sp. TaxID=341027 RepID=UPI0028AE08F9|nr:abortive infection system antitoxin AbiGi family protein [Sphingobacterium sp.]
MENKDIQAIEAEFNQKQINHIFHYTNNFEILKKILRSGFAPSYCEETIDKKEYFIPMVSFCNIPLREVDSYMKYGQYGIGMSMEWALENSISPVIYVHENTPFLKELNPSISNFQFLKNWRTNYKGKDIITYQEREWRFIPLLKSKKKVIQVKDIEFKIYKNKERKKPHLPEYSLNIKQLKYIRYIIINSEKRRNPIVQILNKKFGEKEVINAILSGNLIIINSELIRNDF